MLMLVLMLVAVLGIAEVLERRRMMRRMHREQLEGKVIECCRTRLKKDSLVVARALQKQKLIQKLK